MSKVSGIGSFLFVDQYDLSGDVGAISSITASRNLQDVSNIQQGAVQRLPLLRDGSLAFNAFFDAAGGGSHPVLSGLTGAQSLWTWASGAAAGAVAASLQAREADFGVTRGADGSLAIAPTAQGDAYGLEWANMLTAGKETFSSAAAGASIDDFQPVFGGSSTSFGLAAYLHAISISSGSATVAIQDSADNTSFANVAGAAFAAVSAATSERIQTATNATVRRYLRINVTGTFSDLVIAVSVVRYLAYPPH